MKSTTFALATLTLAGSATAQSSVTIYGVMDSAFAYGRGSGAGASSVSYLTSGANTTSRIGFRGMEDLGGGLSAGFVLEAQVFVDNGAGQPTNTNNQASGATAGTTGGLSFARRSTVSLMGGWGEVRLGRDFTAHYRNRVEVDPFGNAGVGSIQPFVGSIGGLVSTRASNMIGYFLPANLGGIYGQAQLYLGENASGTAQARDGTGRTLRLGYAAGPLNVSLASGRTQYASTATAGDIASDNLGLQYDLGVVKLMGGLYRDRVASLVPVKAKGNSIGGTVPMGAGEFRVALSRYGTDAGTKPETRKLSLGYVHNLSKRTALFATYAVANNSGSATVGLNTSTTGPNSRSIGYDLGIRHLF